MSWRRLRAGAGWVIGKDVYDPDTHELLGKPQLATPHPDGGWVVIIMPPGSTVPVHIRLYNVLIEEDELQTGEPEPKVDEDTVPLPIVDDDGHGYRIRSSHRRQQRQEEAEQAGAGWVVREEGVSGDEEALPPADAADPDPDDRPAGSHVDPTAELHPRGRPLGRKKQDRYEDGPEQQGHMSNTTGGATMASVAEVKAAIDGANNTAEEAAGIFRAAIEKLGEAQQLMALATESSGRDEVAAANSALAHAAEQGEEAIRAIQNAKEQSEQYAANL